MKKIIALLSLVCILSGCTSRYVRRSLEDIESYIMVRPDSALVVLEDFDRSLLTTGRNRAHHALLHAMALDKNFIDVSDDSLASTAVDYFSKYGPEKYEARSLYYLGLAYYYAGNYEKAIIEYTKAEKVAEKSDSLYLAFSMIGQANAYSKTYNNIEELAFLQRASAIFSSINERYYSDVTQYKLAVLYSEEGKYEEAEYIFESLLSMDTLNDNLRASVLAAYGFLETIRLEPDFSKACRFYKECQSEYGTSYITESDCWAWAYALTNEGNSAEADTIIRNLSDRESSVVSLYWQYLLSKSVTDFPSALRYLEELDELEEERIEKVLRQSLSLAQRDYFEAESEAAYLKIGMKNQSIALIIAASLVIIITLCFLTYLYIQRERAKRNFLLEYVEEINRQLEASRKEDYPALRQKFIRIYRSRFEAIGSLCNQYLQDRNRADIERLMYQKVLLMIEDVKNDKVRKVKFESILNDELDDIMTRFRAEMPKCKEADATMFCYLVAGFNAATISRLMDMSLNNVYAHKRRLRIKIETCHPPHEQIFLEMIS